LNFMESRLSPSYISIITAVASSTMPTAGTVPITTLVQAILNNIKHLHDNKAPANIAITADTGSGTNTDTPAVASAAVGTILQTIWGKIRQVANVANKKVTANAAITGSTKTKITYDSKGLVTAGADLATSDIPGVKISVLTVAQLDAIATIAENSFLSFALQGVGWNGLTSVFATGIWMKSAGDQGRHTQEVFVHYINGVYVQRKFIRSNTNSSGAWSAWKEESFVGDLAGGDLSGNYPNPTISNFKRITSATAVNNAWNNMFRITPGGSNRGYRLAIIHPTSNNAAFNNIDVIIGADNRQTTTALNNYTFYSGTRADDYIRFVIRIENSLPVIDVWIYQGTGNQRNLELIVWGNVNDVSVVSGVSQTTEPITNIIYRDDRQDKAPASVTLTDAAESPTLPVTTGEVAIPSILQTVRNNLKWLFLSQKQLS
jgi:hypothetical protein